MSDLAGLAMAVLFGGLVYLRLGSDVRVKRWLLPVVSAGFGALFGTFFGRFAGPEGYVLGVAMGAMLYMQFRYCKFCGWIRASRWRLWGLLSRKSLTVCEHCGHNY
jgi:hypothetical protein